MSTFKFLNDTPINGTTFTEWHEWLYQNRYRWAVIGYEMIGVTPLYWEHGQEPYKRKVYRNTLTDELTTVAEAVTATWPDPGRAVPPVAEIVTVPEAGI